MTEDERAALAARLLHEQNTRFRRVAKRAYTAAGVNAATWNRATNAETLKPHKQAELVENLWPETEGDWTKIPEPVGGSDDAGRYVASPGERVPAGESDSEVLREIRAMREEQRRMSERLEEHIKQHP